MRDLGSPLGGFRSPFGALSGSVFDPYAVAGFNPDLVFDFAAELYRTSSLVSTFDASLTYTGASLKTMVDSDGLVKWAPHNLTLYSEQFDHASWSKATTTVTPNAAVAPDGTTTADQIDPDTTALSVYRGYNLAGTYTASIWVKNNGRDFCSVSMGQNTIGYLINVDLTDGTYVSGRSYGGGALVGYTIVAAGNGWYKVSVTATAASGGIAVFSGDGVTSSEGMYVWGAHLYRSDLGGMVDNPDRGDSYVPTTSAAVYLPRRGHHIYNGSAWVNEGILLESEARTNRITESQDLTNAAWVIQNTNSLTLTDNQAVGPDGNTTLTRLEITDTANEDHFILFSDTLVTGSAYTLSAVVKADEVQFVNLNLLSNSGLWVTGFFDISGGTVGTTAGGATAGVVVDATIENLGGGLYRISLSGTCTGSFVSVGLGTASSATPTLNTSDGKDNYAGVAGDGFFAGHMQLEIGYTPSSYIPTAGATVTRAAETLTVAAADLPYSAVNMSIQMDGEMTYADNGLSYEVVPFYWWASTTNYIRTYLRTTSGRTGQLNFAQRQSASGLDNTTSAIGYFAPDVNVSYNVASRHGATFINGAEGGTALTANTTPTALPDLSATNLLIGSLYMGTIGKFRMWDEDLGDTGIAEASARTYTTEFAMIVATTTASETFTIPCQNVGTFNAVIDWGDNSNHSTITTYNDADLAHVYNSPGDHVIRITGTFPNLRFNNTGDKLKVKSVENFGKVGWISLTQAFYGCTNMTSFIAGTCDTSAVTNMSDMFRTCSGLTSLDVTNFNTALVTNMNKIFRGCSSLTSLDVTNFNTALVNDMLGMFYDCIGLTSLDVTNFNTASATNMSDMFRSCTVLTSLDVTNFNTALVTDINSMFYGCTGLTSLDVSGFNTASVTDMFKMFFGCTSLTDIVGVDAWDIGGLNSTGDLTNFATNVTLPTARYDALLLAWEAQDPFDGMSPNFGSSTYTGGGAVATAHASLISRDGWTITDGGVA